MKPLFFLSHPAHYHLFRRAIRGFAEAGHAPRVLLAAKDVLAELVADEDWDCLNLLPEGRRGGFLPAPAATALGVLKTEWRLLKNLLGDRPDVLVGTELTLAHLGTLLRIPSLLFNEDDTAATPENHLFYPFATALVLPRCCDAGKWEKKRASYPGYHELAYLRPETFTPDRETAMRLSGGERYGLLRLAELTASHDLGKTGIGNELARRVIGVFREAGVRPLITAERPLAPEFEPYRVAAPARDMGHLTAFAEVYAGDSQTMAAEAAVLGTPSVRFNDFVGRLSYLEELEHVHGLTVGIKTTHPERLVETVRDVLAAPDPEAARRERLARRDRMLAATIDPVPLFIRLIELGAARAGLAAMRREAARFAPDGPGKEN